MNEKVKMGSLHNIRIPEREVNWIKYGREILINGRMFDIKSYFIQNGIFFFSGLFDDDETALMDQIKKDHQDDADSRKQIVHLFNLFQNLYTNSDDPDSFLKPLQRQQYPVVLTSSHLSPFISIFIPPPQV